MPIAAGEGECGRESFRPLIERQALDVYQVDLARNGFTDAAYIKNRVEEAGARLCNHCYTSPITVAASLHWLATCRDAFLFEDCVEDSPLRNELTVERVQAVDGWIKVPNGPGLGVTLDEKFVAAHLILHDDRGGGSDVSARADTSVGPYREVSSTSLMAWLRRSHSVRSTSSCFRPFAVSA